MSYVISWIIRPRNNGTWLYTRFLCLVSVHQTAKIISIRHGIWAPSQYPKRRLSVRSRKVSKPRDWYFKLSYRFQIWQAHRQHCCRSACQIPERSDNYKYKSRGFETLRDLTEIRLFGYWDGALVMSSSFLSITWLQFGWKQICIKFELWWKVRSFNVSPIWSASCE